MKVEPYKTGLCQGNAYWMAVLSNLAYEGDTGAILEKLNSMENGGSFEKVTGFNNKSSQAIFVEHQNYLAMVFRGTDELVDWVDNIDIRREKTPLGKFHKGFWDAIEDIWNAYGKGNEKKPGIFEVYQEARSREKRPLFIAGHSLGGGMATVAAAKLLEQDLPFTSVYTFGQPRAVDVDDHAAFNGRIGNRYFRFQNNNDIVTRVPARISRFSHVGKCLYITTEGDIKDDPGFWFRFLDNVEGIAETMQDWSKGGFELGDFIADHKMPRYMNFIGECKKFPNS